MKRADLLEQLRKIARDSGRAFHLTEGGSHTRVCIGDQITYVPRHNEINEMTAKAIPKQAKGLR